MIKLGKKVVSLVIVATILLTCIGNPVFGASETDSGNTVTIDSGTNIITDNICDSEAFKSLPPSLRDSIQKRANKEDSLRKMMNQDLNLSSNVVESNKMSMALEEGDAVGHDFATATPIPSEYDGTSTIEDPNGDYYKFTAESGLYSINLSTSVDWGTPAYYVLYDSNQSIVSNAMPGERKPVYLNAGQEYYVYVYIAAYTEYNLKIHKEQKQNWTIKNNMPQSTAVVSAVVVDGSIYAFDGYSNNMLVYTPSTDTWTTQPIGLNNSRSAYKVAQVGGKIYFIGGCDGNGNLLNTVVEYDPSINTWTEKEASMAPQPWFETVVANDKIYTIGGDNEGVSLNMVQEYDPVADQWTTKQNIPTARDCVGLATVNNKIYALGGWNGELGWVNTAEVYDTESDQWSTINNMPTSPDGFGTAQYGFGTAVLNNKIYTIGGWDENYYETNSMEEYDPTTNEWNSIEDMYFPRGYPATATVDGKIYAFGGSNVDSLSNVCEEYDPHTGNTVGHDFDTATPIPSEYDGTSMMGDTYEDYYKFTAESGLYSINLSATVDWGTTAYYYLYDNNRSKISSAALGERKPLYLNAGQEYYLCVYITAPVEYNLKIHKEEQKQNWTIKNNLPRSMILAGSVELNGSIYAFDGYPNNMMVYTPSTDTWTTQPIVLNNSRRDYKVAKVNGKIYLIGGSDADGNAINTVVEYNPATNEWVEKNGCMAPQPYFEAVAANGKIYTIGGSIGDYETGQALNLVQEYDPITDQWTTKQNMPTGRDCIGLATINNKIYAFGGWNNQLGWVNTAEVYDVENDQWSTINNLPTTNYSFGTVVLNDKIYTIGGWDENNYQINTVEEYDPSTNEWNSIEDMYFPRANPGVATVNGKIYVFGGNLYDSYSNVCEEYDPHTEGNTVGHDFASATPIPSEYDGTSTIEDPNGDYYKFTAESGLYSINLSTSVDWGTPAYYVLYDSNQSIVSNAMPGERKPVYLNAGQQYYVYVYIAAYTEYNLKIHKEQKQNWTIKNNMPQSMTLAGSVELNGSIYAFDEYSNNMLVYTPSTDTWATQPIGRRAYKVAQVGGKIYFIGGYDGNGDTFDTVAEYNPASNEWVEKNGCMAPQPCFEVVAANDKIYTIGGDNDGVSLNMVQEYDPVADQWTTKQNIPTARDYVGLATVNNKIYALGGWNDELGWVNTAEVYDVESNQWSTINNMPTAKHGFGTAVLNNKIYTIGGLDENGYETNSVEEYDPSTNEWSSIEDMYFPRCWPATATVNGKIYAIGGSNDSSFTNICEEYDPHTALIAPVLNEPLPTDITDTSVNLTWSESKNINEMAGYDVYENDELKETVMGLNDTISNLMPYTSYRFKIIARDKEGSQAESNEIQVTTTDTVAPSPAPVLTEPSYQDITNTTVNLTWTESMDDGGMAGYEVYVNDEYRETVTGLNYTVSGLVLYNTYRFKVIAKDRAGNRTESNEVSATTIGTIATAEGLDYTLVLKGDGTVWACGRNSSRQLGDGTVIDRNNLVQVKGQGGVGYLKDIIAISAYGSQSAALKSDGTVWEWGTGTSLLTPTQVKGVGGVGYLTGIVGIAVGSGHKIALKNDGTVWAWGSSYYGQLGNGAYDSSLTPVQVKYLNEITAVFASDTNSYAIKNDGTAWAWGDNTYYQLGNIQYSNKSKYSVPVQVQGLGGVGYLSGIVLLAPGRSHVAALDSNGKVWTWGRNNSGQLGDGTTSDKRTPIQVNINDQITAICAGYGNTKALSIDGSVWAWGGTPVKVKGLDGIGILSDVIKISSGAYHYIAIKNDGTVWTWGSNGSGQLINNNHTTQSTPVQALDSNHASGHLYLYTSANSTNLNSLLPSVGTLSPQFTSENTLYNVLVNSSVNNIAFTSTTANNRATVTVNGQTVTSGSVSQNISLSSGENIVNILVTAADGATKKYIINVYVRDLPTYTGTIATAGGQAHTLILKSDGTVWACGLNGNGQLGNGTTTDSNALVQVKGSGGVGTLNNVVAISADSLQSAALKSDGTVWQWGIGKLYPTQVKLANGTALSGIIAIAVGSDHMIALKSDGTVWTWGGNTYGELGDGTLDGKSNPVQINLNGIIAVCADGSSSYALKNDGTVYAWGYNNYGQLGDGTEKNRWTPVRVIGPGGVGYLSGITSLAVGSCHAAALANDGTVWAWGINQSGQLGDGSLTGSSERSDLPVKVKNSDGTHDLEGVTAICAVDSSTLAMRIDGSVWKFGNQSGQICLAVQVKGPGGIGCLSDIIMISSGDNHYITVKSDGTVWSWGYNSSGQLMNNNHTDQSTSVQALDSADSSGFLHLFTVN